MLLLSMMPAASAMAASAPAVTSVNLSSEQGTVAVGNTVSFTATATQSGNGTPLYQFWYQGVHGNWHGTNWSTKNTFSLPALQQGSYEVVVYAKDNGQTVLASSEGTNTNQFVNVDSSASLTPSSSLTDVKPDSTINFTASSKNLTDPVYQLWIQRPNGKWYASGNYQTSPNFSVTVGQSGTYNVVLYAKDVNAPQTWRFSEYATASAVVYGQPAAVTLSPSSSSIAADGQATDTITATVVDSNGNTVTNYNGKIGVVVDPNDFDTTTPLLLEPGNATNVNTAADTQSSPYWINVTNGVATINLKEITSGFGNFVSLFPGVVGSTASVTPMLPNGSLETSNAASIKVVAPSGNADAPVLVSSNGSATPLTNGESLPNNVPSDIAVQEVDQSGAILQPHISLGTAVVSVSGPATLKFMSQPNLTHVTVPLDALGALTLVPNQNATGPVTITVSNATNGLPGQSVTVNLAAPSMATQWSATGLASSYTADQIANNYLPNNPTIDNGDWNFAPGASGTAPTVSNPLFSPTVALTAQNGAGLSSNAPMPSVKVIGPNGSSPSNLVVANLAPVKPTSGQNDYQHYTFNLAYTGRPLAEGAYQVDVKEGLTTTKVISFNITAGTPTGITVSPSNSKDVTTTSPSTTVTAQLVDALGNAVAAPSGWYAQFTAIQPPSSSSSQHGEVTLSGGSGTKGSQKVYFNSNGKASITATGVNYPSGTNDPVLDGNVDVSAYEPDAVSGPHFVAKGQSGLIYQGAEFPSQILNGQLSSSTYTVGGSASFPVMNITEELSNGTPAPTGDMLKYTVTSSNPASPSYTNTVKYTKANQTLSIPKTDIAGNYTVTVTDVSNTNTTSATQSFSVKAGSVAGIGLFTSNGMNEIAQSAGISSKSGLNAGIANYPGFSAPQSVTGNTPMGLWVSATDASGNPVAAPKNGLTVDLSAELSGGAANGIFETSSGQSLYNSATKMYQVVIPAGQTGVEIYYADPNSQSVDFNAQYVQTPALSVTNGLSATSTAKQYQTTVSLSDQLGNPMLAPSSSDFTLDVAGVTYTYSSSATSTAGDFYVTSMGNGHYTLTFNDASTLATGATATVGYQGASATTSGYNG